MRCLAQTQGPKVRVNAVLPGLLLTEWVGAAFTMACSDSAKILLGKPILAGKDKANRGQGCAQASSKCTFKLG